MIYHLLQTPQAQEGDELGVRQIVLHIKVLVNAFFVKRGQNSRQNEQATGKLEKKNSLEKNFRKVQTHK